MVYELENLQQANERYRALAMNGDYFECQLPVLMETEKAICFNTYAGHLNHEKKAWVPKSQCEIVEHTEFGRRIFIKTWLYGKLA